MKKCFQKYKPIIINFQEYTHFQKNAFREDLLSKLLNFNIQIDGKSFTEFFESSNNHLNYQALCKQKYARGNHLSFINKGLSNEIMKNTRLSCNFLKDRNRENKGVQNKETVVYHLKVH